MEDTKTPYEEQAEKNRQSLIKDKWEEYEKFYENHALQLYGINFPKELGEKLYYKLKYEVFDTSRFFEIIDNQNEERMFLKAKVDIKKEFEVFLVDHSWTFKIRQFNEFCEKYPNIIQRVLQMTKYSNLKRDILTLDEYSEKKKFSDVQDAINKQIELNFQLSDFTITGKAFIYKYLDFDSHFIENPNETLTDFFQKLVENAGKSSIKKPIFLGLSIENNQIKSLSILKEFLYKINKLTEGNFDLKAIWVESNPFEVIDEEYKEELILEFENIELINRKLNKNSGLWSLEYLYSTYALETNFGERYKDKFDGKVYNDLHANKRNFIDFNSRDPLAFEKFDLLREFINEKNINFVDIADNYYDISQEENLISFISLFPNLEVLIVDENTEGLFQTEEENYEENLDALKIISKNISLIKSNCPKLKLINSYSVDKLSKIDNDALLKYQKENWVKNNMWKIIQTYRLMTSNKYDEDSTWYINDEFGSAINHSDSFNVALFPFLFSPSNTFKDDIITYSIMWPVKEIRKNDEILRDYLHNINEANQRSARLTCWFNTPKDYFLGKFYEKMEKLGKIGREFEQNLQIFLQNIENLTNLSNDLTKSSEFEEYYKNTFDLKTLLNKIEENKKNKASALKNPQEDLAYMENNKIYDADLEVLCKKNIKMSLNQIDIEKKIPNIEKYFIENFISKNKKIKVFSDLEYVRNNLKNTIFEIVSDITNADILWLNTDIFKLIDRGIFETNQSVENTSEKIYFKNQFPFEGILTMKSHLGDLIQENFGLNNFLGLTYYMDTELSSLIGNYFYNKDNYIDNTWILKPINMTRSMDMIVTDNIDEIIRSVETGPKICQKYIDRPLLLNNKKFDLRFIIMIKKVVPLEAYIYSKMFWVRSANKDFTMDSRSFTDYETHFTVMNYSNFEKKTIYNYEFVEYLEKNGINWEEIYKKIKIDLKNLLLMASKNCPQMADSYSRSIYGIDIMIDEDLNPRILEVNFSPDCTRACKFVPEFFDQIFSTLFLEDPQGVEKL